MNPLISVITLNWNRKDDVSRTLESILADQYEPKEVIMVDNGSTDGSTDAVKSQFPGVKVIELNKNEGVRGYNEGIEAASGEIILLVDNDMDLLQTDSMQKIAVYFNSNPRLGVAALQVRDQTRKNLSPNNPKYWEQEGNDSCGYPCSTFDGGGAAFRKSVLQQTGLYLAEFFVYHSEVDLSTRIWDAGYEIRYFPEVAVSHRESPVARNTSLQTFYSARNYLWYVWIYYPRSMRVVETLHFLQRSAIRNMREGKSLWAWLRGVAAAISGWPRISHLRKPAKRETIEWMQKLRVKDRERKERTADQN
jgi:GT2 family glycosyltransferase